MVLVAFAMLPAFLLIGLAPLRISVLILHKNSFSVKSFCEETVEETRPKKKEESHILRLSSFLCSIISVVKKH
jgi:hypothetical protein